MKSGRKSGQQTPRLARLPSRRHALVMGPMSHEDRIEKIKLTWSPRLIQPKMGSRKTCWESGIWPVWYRPHHPLFGLYSCNCLIDVRCGHRSSLLVHSQTRIELSCTIHLIHEAWRESLRFYLWSPRLELSSTICLIHMRRGESPLLVHSGTRTFQHHTPNKNEAWRESSTCLLVQSQTRTF